MARHDNQSDSEDESPSEIETSVLLGIPDGHIDASTDIADAAVSRIGGHPAFLPSREPPFSSSQCKICANPSELLIQIWCPFEDSPMDRALYVWGCARSACQGKQGSVRAWRGLRRNDAYAAKLEKKLAKKRVVEDAKAEAAAAEAERRKNPKQNPFSMNTPSSLAFSNNISSTFGTGIQLFGDTPAKTFPVIAHSSPSFDSNSADNDDEASGDDASASDEDSLAAMASITLVDSPWASAPSYPPIYLSTVQEYLPPQPKSRLPPGIKVTDPLDDNDKRNSNDIFWASETYEDSLEVDNVFERFTKRVGYENEQCIRYELNGTPLPYSSDEIFRSLFPSPPAPTLTVTKSTFSVIPKRKRAYFPTSLTPCPSCRSQRIFECQLMPNLINVLRRTEAVGRTTELERRKAVERVLKGSNAANTDTGRAIDWGTCMIFSCEKDCSLDERGAEARECWREEFVLIQTVI